MAMQSYCPFFGFHFVRFCRGSYAYLVLELTVSYYSRWRIQYLEKGNREMLEFGPGRVSTMVQVTDLRNSLGLLKAELCRVLYLLQVPISYRYISHEQVDGHDCLVQELSEKIRYVNTGLRREEIFHNLRKAKHSFFHLSPLQRKQNVSFVRRNTPGMMIWVA